MTTAEKIQEGLLYVLVAVFDIGWMDFGQGKDLTWWSLIQYMAGGQ